jgi:hypothetical protein
VKVSNQASDAPHFEPMLELILVLLQHRHRTPTSPPAARDLDARGRMVRKICSKTCRAIIALRKTIALCKTIVELVFGQIQGARGLDRFLLRELEKVDGQLTLMASATTSSSCSGRR